QGADGRYGQPALSRREADTPLVRALDDGSLREMSVDNGEHVTSSQHSHQVGRGDWNRAPANRGLTRLRAGLHHEEAAAADRVVSVTQLAGAYGDAMLVARKQKIVGAPAIGSVHPGQGDALTSPRDRTGILERHLAISAIGYERAGIRILLRNDGELRLVAAGKRQHRGGGQCGAHRAPIPCHRHGLSGLSIVGASASIAATMPAALANRANCGHAAAERLIQLRRLPMRPGGSTVLPAGIAAPSGQNSYSS